MTTRLPTKSQSKLPKSRMPNTLGTSNTSDTPSTPKFTPSETPPHTHNSSPPDFNDLSAVDMEENHAGSSNLREEVQPTKTENPAAQTEAKSPDAADIKKKKTACKKHSKIPKKTKKRSKAKEESSSEDESSSSDSSSSDTEDDEESEAEDSCEEEDSEEERRQKRKQKQKQKAKKAKKLKDKKKKVKSRKHKGSSDEGSESEEGDESSSEEEDKRKKSKSSKKKRSKKKQLDEQEQAATDFQTQLSKLRLLGVGGGLNRRRGGRQPVMDDQLLKQLQLKGRGKKKQKRGSKADFVRVDQLWDSSIHNYKLTETAEDADADEYDQYVFTVRRKFDWENKYTDTVVDIKSKPLKEALTHVMGAVKGVSFAEETPIIDPNMLFLYLEELRSHMKELRSQSKTERKKKAKKATTLKAQHVKVLIKYLDKDYAETKKTLYPLLESNTITFDLLWALFKSNEIAYCPTYSNPDEPRAFKIEYATKVW